MLHPACFADMLIQPAVPTCRATPQAKKVADATHNLQRLSKMATDVIENDKLHALNPDAPAIRDLRLEPT